MGRAGLDPVEVAREEAAAGSWIRCDEVEQPRVPEVLPVGLCEPRVQGVLVGRVLGLVLQTVETREPVLVNSPASRDAGVN